jgi:hypothetical protein
MDESQVSNTAFGVCAAIASGQILSIVREEDPLSIGLLDGGPSRVRFAVVVEMNEG